MLRLILLPIFTTCVLYLVNSFMKKTPKISMYALFFITLLFIEVFYFTMCKLYCQDDDPINIRMELYSDFSEGSKCRIYEELSLYDHQMLTSDQRVEFKRKIAFHKKEGVRCFNEAKANCKLIPNISDRNKAFALFSTAITTSAGALLNGYAGIVSTLLADLALWAANYHCEWVEMKTLLKESKHHYEMCNFYQDGLDNDIDY